MFDWIIRWSLRNRLEAVLLLYGLMVVAAVIAAGRMAVDVFPEFAPPQGADSNRGARLFSFRC